MKKLLLHAAILFGLTVSTYADQYVFTPNDGSGDPNDIWDLDHYKYFTWGIKNFSIPQGQVVTEAVLTFYDINNWTAAENNGNNWLHAWLFDSVAYQNNGPTGRLKVFTDNQGGGDNFLNSSSNWSAAKAKIGTYIDYDGGSGGDTPDISFTFSALGLLDELNSYISNGNNFGLGFDPDCHYWNTGVKLKITTGSPPRVPDGGTTLMLLGIGLFATAGIKRLIRA